MRYVLAIYLFMWLILAGINPPWTWAETQFNPYTGEWETTDSGDELKFNPYSGNWSYEDPDSDLEYNPYSGGWDYVEDED